LNESFGVFQSYWFFLYTFRSVDSEHNNGRNIFLCCIFVEVVWRYRLLSYIIFKFQLIVGLINPNYISNSRLVSFESALIPPNGLWVSNFIVILNQKKVRKIRNFSTEKTLPYPGFEPRTRLAVGTLHHCTIGLVFIHW
jgi:hypothetical protein